jgi:hypothetical protein
MATSKQEPDGGTTVMLLRSALTSLGVVRRYLKMKRQPSRRLKACIIQNPIDRAAFPAGLPDIRTFFARIIKRLWRTIKHRLPKLTANKRRIFLQFREE